MSIISFFTAVIMMFTTLACGCKDIPQSGYTDSFQTLTLPVSGGADPWYCQHDGMYYACYSVGNGVGVKCAASIGELASSRGRTVYTAPEGTEYSCNYWAPELHYIDGMWYIYVAADDGNNENHRMYALQCELPMGDYEFCGKIYDSSDKWAIDGTVAEIGGELYFIWSGWKADTNGKQSLYIAHMSDPLTVDSARSLICEPDLPWEKKGMPINEGPEILKKDGAVYLIYSASGSWTDDYCLGMLKLAGNDPLKRASWAKNPVPVFKKTDCVFGVGHCSFVSSPDGKYDYIVYHGMSESGSGWSGRSIRIQRFEYKNSCPVFGKPVASGKSVDIAD